MQEDDIMYFLVLNYECMQIFRMSQFLCKLLFKINTLASELFPFLSTVQVIKEYDSKWFCFAESSRHDSNLWFYCVNCICVRIF
jgi:hypothetical protein